MKMMLKICGLSTPQSVEAARDNGASHLGFIFFPKSPRNVSPQQAADLVKHVGSAKTVAVTVNAEDDFLDEIVATMRPDLLQLHGAETAERIDFLKARHGLPILKALAIREEADIAKVNAYDGLVDLLLLDAKPPKGADLPGGNGVTFDWSLLDNLQTKSPVLLSGGIGLDNIERAIAYVHDTTNSIEGLDVSSGVESAPGVKDDAKIKAFLEACLQD